MSVKNCEEMGESSLTKRASEIRVACKARIATGEVCLQRTGFDQGRGAFPSARVPPSDFAQIR